MLKNIVVPICLVAIAVFALGCTHNFSELNTDPNGTTTAYPEQLLAPALVNALTANMTRNRTFNNELMQVTVSQSEDETAVFRYNFPVSWSLYLYNALYSELANFRDIYLLSSDSTSAQYNQSYMGISLICQAWLFSILTDTYGDIPFSEALLGRDSLNFTPKFDTQKDVYEGLFDYLEQANTLLSTGTTIDGSYDPVFSGDVTQWRKFGNSLYLRLLLRVSGKSEVQDSCIAKIQEIVNNTSSYPIMTSTSDAAILQWTGVGAYVSPWYSVRAQTFRSVALCSFFIDYLNVWGDPLIDYATYGTNGVCRWGIAPVSGSYAGVASGYLPGYGEDIQSYFYAIDETVNSVSPPSNCMQVEPLTGMMMNYAELQFILCECASKGWITSTTAATYYNNGVQARITQWLSTWTVDVADYLTAADMSWDDSEDDSTKMEKIQLQKYYALFCTDLQQWFEYRRTGHPVLPKGAGLHNGGVMPARMQYPAYLLGSNPVHYAEAVADQGADVISTQVWWQKSE
ncbi:MAG: SusD/RagB family nutrient-binding outer membrane lipoprotein [Chitinophagaceae bacterium]